MSKAEKRALKAFPLKIDGDSRGSYDLNIVKRIVYQQGYEQAEKDLELTVDDIMKIDALLIEMWNKPSNKDGYQEVLKRFKDLKKGKNYEIQDKVQRPYKQAKAVCQ